MSFSSELMAVHNRLLPSGELLLPIITGVFVVSPCHCLAGDIAGVPKEGWKKRCMKEENGRQMRERDGKGEMEKGKIMCFQIQN